jgi:hypothetical protein
MRKQPLRFTGSALQSPAAAVSRHTPANATLSYTELEHLAREWIYDCQFRQHSKSTLANRRLFLDKLIWFLTTHDCTQCRLSELRRFCAYLTTAHENADGRWGSVGKCNAARKPHALEPSPLLPYGMADHYSEDSSFSHFAATSTSLMSLT